MNITGKHVGERTCALKESPRLKSQAYHLRELCVPKQALSPLEARVSAVLWDAHKPAKYHSRSIQERHEIETNRLLSVHLCITACLLLKLCDSITEVYKKYF